ncbi:MAG: hypothetical protein NTU49_05725 [Gammaproteobacteria bacterium]|nr:hypothetical protein [Gammaproteobacteria bacterium]
MKNVYATLFLSDRFLDTSLLSEADKKAAVSEYQKLIQSRIIKKFEQLDKNPKSAIADHNHNREEEKSVAPISLEEAEKIKMPPKEITYNQQLAHLVAKKLVAHDETSSLLASRFHSSLFSICPVEKLLTLGRTNVDELVVLQKNAQQNFSPLNNGKITQKTIDTLMDFVAGGCLTLTEAYKLNSEEINFLTDPKIARFIQNEFQENGNYNSKVIPTLLELSRNNGKKDFLQFYNSDKADLTVALEKYAETENAYKSNSANATWRSNTVNEIINEEVKNFGELLKAKGYDPEQNDPAKKLFDEYKERVSTPKKRKELLNIFSYSATEKEAKQRIADDVNVVLYQSSMENDNLRRSSFDKSKPWASIQDDVNGLDIHHKIRAPLENAINEKIGAYKKELGFDFKNDKEAQHILNYFESEINSVAAKKIKKLLTETGEINFDKIATDIVEAAKKDPLLGSNPSDIPFYIASEKFAELSVTNAKAEIQKRVDEAVKQVWGIGKYNDSFKSFNPRFSHIVGDCSSIAMLHQQFPLN